MSEFFIRAVSNPAPFVGDESFHYVEADNVTEAVGRFVSDYNHPAGMFGVTVYTSADDYHKNRDPLSRISFKSSKR